MHLTSDSLGHNIWNNRLMQNVEPQINMYANGPIYCTMGLCYNGTQNPALFVSEW